MRTVDLFRLVKTGADYYGIPLSGVLQPGSFRDRAETAALDLPAGSIEVRVQRDALPRKTTVWYQRGVYEVRVVEHRGINAVLWDLVTLSPVVGTFNIVPPPPADIPELALVTVAGEAILTHDDQFILVTE